MLNSTDRPAAAFADPALDAAKRSAETNAMAAAPVLEPSEPIAGPIPLPPMRPRLTVAQITGAVPLPRPRPAEASPRAGAGHAAAVDRHTVE